MKKIIFVVIIEEIHDPEMYADYIKRVAKIIQAHNGEYVARSSHIIPLSGEKPERSIILAFDSMEDAKKCFLSQKYEEIKHYRENSTRSRAFFIQND